MKPGVSLLWASAGLVVVIGIFACGAPQTSPTGAAGYLAGRVTEPGGLGLPGATLKLIGGSKNGETTTTDYYGVFSFPDAGDAPQIQAMKSGYLSSTVTIVPGASVWFALTPTVPYADVSGTYQVALTASPSCQLPDDARTRAYSATIAQNSASLTLTFSGAQFPPNANFMSGRVYGTTVNLTIGTVANGINYDCFYYNNCFIEDLSGGRTLMLNGTGSGTASASTIDVQVAGVLSLTGVSPPATCTAPDHHLTFSK